MSIVSSNSLESTFQNLIVLSAVPPPDKSNPNLWGDHAIAFTAA